MKGALKEIVGGFYSLVVGMRITLAQFFRPVVTVQYPHESLKMPPRFRGPIELVRDPATGKSLCVACKACEKACPSDCIFVEGSKRTGEKKKSPAVFRVDFTKCSLCGACVEVCPTDALRFSKAFNLASARKDDFIMDLLKRLETEQPAANEP
jgi:NADH-quinone oxidoreductase subunit I